VNLITLFRRYRTWGVGIIAVASLFYAAIFSFDVDVMELLVYFAFSVLLIAVVIGSAALTIMLLKRLGGNRSGSDDR